MLMMSGAYVVVFVLQGVQVTLPIYALSIISIALQS